MKTRSKRKTTSPSSSPEVEQVPSKKSLFSDLSTESESDGDEEVIVIKTEIKEEKSESDQRPLGCLSTAADDDSDDDVMILEEIPTEVSVLGVRVKKQEPDVIAIDDEDQDETSDEDDEESPPSSSRPSEIRREVVKNTPPYLPASRIIPIYPDRCCTKELKLHRNQTQHVQLTTTPIAYASRKWASFYRTHAENFTIFESDLWTWTDVKDGSGSNLFLALKHAVNIVELRIGSSCSGPCTYVPSKRMSLKLRRLKNLKICHGGEMNYEDFDVELNLVMPSAVGM